jgi:hypothetical protein
VEQRALLRSIVGVYEAGCKDEFRVLSTQQGAVLMYSQHEGISIDTSDSDFEQLAREGVITLRRDQSRHLRGKPTELGIRLVHEGSLDAAVSKSISKVIAAGHGRVFIGHGRSAAWKELRELLEQRLNLLTDEFNREPAAGYSTKEILDRMLTDACFAFLVMTGEEVATDGSTKARENVVHEIGLFQGRLGFHKAIVLLEEGCVEFSNIHGLTQIRFPKGNIMSVSEEIRRVLEREGLLLTGS